MLPIYNPSTSRRVPLPPALIVRVFDNGHSDQCEAIPDCCFEGLSWWHSGQESVCEQVGVLAPGILVGGSRLLMLLGEGQSGWHVCEGPPAVPKSLQMVIAAMKLKDSLEGKL